MISIYRIFCWIFGHVPSRYTGWDWSLGEPVELESCATCGEELEDA